jgi:phosphopantothenoylcysteine decarboxylase/phosphopantothenate--cysteine ligase
MQVLLGRGHVIVEPGEGLLACGTIGPGRLAEPAEIADMVLAVSKKNGRRDLEGETVLITAGPTQEPIDGVRYLSNRSSGKMGYALAEEAAARGARVVLVSGPVSLAPPREVTLIPVRTALEMRQAVMEHLTEASIVIKAAAVADYHIPNPSKHKMKKTAARLSLDLEPTPDILAELGTKKGDRLLIGFAAETDNMIEEARRKMQQKNCDMVVGNVVAGNVVARTQTGFESDENEVVLVTRTGATIPVERASKRAIAGRIFDEALRLRLALHVSR